MVKAYESHFSDGVLRELLSKLGEDKVSTRLVDKIASCRGVAGPEYRLQQKDKYPYLPDAVVFPENAGEVSGILKTANKYKTAVIPYSGGSGNVMGTVFYNGGICVDCKYMDSLTVNEKDCTITVGAGYNGEKLERDLNRRGFTHGHYPQSIRSSTPGGWAGPIAIGTFSTKYGKFDDMVISMEVVLPTGEIMVTSDSPKKSAGPNLNQLIVGSEGAFGIVTKVTMRIWPAPEVRDFEVYNMPSNVDGLEGIRRFIQQGIRPAVVRLYDEDESYERNEKWGYDPMTCYLLMGYDGTRAQVELEKSMVREALERNGGRLAENSLVNGQDWFNKTRFNVTNFLEVIEIPGAGMESMEVSATWEKLPGVIRAMKNAAKPSAQLVYGHTSHVYHTGAMVYMIFVHITDGNEADGVKAFAGSMKKCLDACVAAGGTFAHHHGVGTLKSQWMESEHNEGYEVMKKIKKALDPNNIMNPAVLGFGGRVDVEGII